MNITNKKSETKARNSRYICVLQTCYDYLFIYSATFLAELHENGLPTMKSNKRIERRNKYKA